MFSLLRHKLVFAALLLVTSKGAVLASETASAEAAAAQIAAQALEVLTQDSLGRAPQAMTESSSEEATGELVAMKPEAMDEDVSPPGAEFAKIRPKARKASYSSAAEARLSRIRPKGRPYEFVLPNTRWEHRPGNEKWTHVAMKAVLSHGKPLTRTVPSDYREWCPAYAENDEFRRAMFWVGFMSALAKHESTYRADAVGGGGLWYGLLQILPSTARLYKCQAKTGEALKDGGLNLSCATRIMSKTVARDQVIHGFYPNKKRKYQGVTQDWGPMHSSSKRAEMAAWTRKQAYCVSHKTLRPKLRPDNSPVQKKAKTSI
ncbi:transglycosylase SLT domain-containing protein [Lentibacter sp. XHP0401]|jgi:Transglycosylase SLT domain|uniref:transglycosylase SLT domain-containing protein n=1 Tax=Lentibacter sp. XHP0401 TaxID=2984334 RepID=UPI0021E97B83|nr:transglycosylase SLT domain-containing protein [Lentibacter sp. XHP0401]MCV2891662.1 transglycosylase SLT domain-containing protein [Lentibacter sp. XHP0401]